MEDGGVEKFRKEKGSCSRVPPGGQLRQRLRNDPWIGNSEVPGDLCENSLSGEGEPDWDGLSNLKKARSGDSERLSAEKAKQEKASQKEMNGQCLNYNGECKTININGSQFLRTSWIMSILR